MKAHAIIQARLGSSRLPGKMLLKVGGKTILEYGLERIKKAKRLSGIIVATTIKEEDLAIIEVAKKVQIHAYQGEENDVLDRFYQAAKQFAADHIVRLTADCPLIDPAVIDTVVNHYFSTGADYCSNTIKETFPDGQDVEVFSFRALEISWREAKLSSEREHVTPYFKKHPEKFKLVSLENPIDLSQKRWTLDTQEDFEFIKKIIESLYPENPNFTMQDILEFLKKNPQLEEINKNIIRNAGYLKSLKEDRVVR